MPRDDDEGQDDNKGAEIIDLQITRLHIGRKNAAHRHSYYSLSKLEYEKELRDILTLKH